MRKIARIIGQAPACECGKRPLRGDTGKKLARIIGLSISDLAKIFALDNLLYDTFPMQVARAAAAAKTNRIKEKTVFLLGKNVASAFGFRNAKYFEWIRHNGKMFVCVPYPSEKNRWYNKENNRAVAMQFFDDFFKKHDLSVSLTTNTPNGEFVGRALVNGTWKKVFELNTITTCSICGAKMSAGDRYVLTYSKKNSRRVTCSRCVPIETVMRVDADGTDRRFFLEPRNWQPLKSQSDEEALLACVRIIRAAGYYVLADKFERNARILLSSRDVINRQTAQTCKNVVMRLLNFVSMRIKYLCNCKGVGNECALSLLSCINRFASEM